MTEGGVSSPVLHCIFNSGSITHYMHDVDPLLINQLPNLYAVCLANKVAGKRAVFGGFFISTTYSHTDVDNFGAACTSAISTMKELLPLMTSTTTLLPARIPLPAGEKPLTENEMVAVIFQQYFKFHEIGQA